MSFAKQFGTALLCLLPVFVGLNPLFCQEGARPSNAGSETGDQLLARIWNGIQEAETKYTSGCGRITETRTSKLLVRPLIFRGTFCASGKDKFKLEYFEPEPLRLVFNRDCLNVTTGRDKKRTDVLNIGDNVARTQRYFSKENSLKNLKQNFEITVRQSPFSYEMKFVPRSQRFKQKINYVVVTLRKNDFLLSALEIDGKSGVNSIFVIEIDSLNKKIGEDVYKVYRP